MFQDITKLDEHHDKRTLTMGSTDEAAAYARCFIDTETHRTHRIVAKWVGPLKLELYPELLPLEEIARKTSGFNDLGVSELRTLAASAGVDTHGHANSTTLGDREALVANLVAKAAETAPTPPATKPESKPSVVIGAEIRQMSDADLETRAAELGVADKHWGKRSRNARMQAVAAAAANNQTCPT